MEESAYIPNSIPPGLVVFSQAGYGDAMRMQRPFSSQVPDKELNLSSLSPSTFGLRPMDSFPGLPAQLVHLQQNPFLHPALEGRFPFGSSGAFRPLASSHNTPASTTSSNSAISTESTTNGGHNTLKNLPSAFSSPNQSSGSRRSDISGIMDCRNREQQEKSGSYINGGQSHRRRSPASPSAKNSGKEERKSVDRESNGDEGEVHGSPCSDLTDRSSPEEPHHPKRRRKGGPDTLNCPVCKMALRSCELESHLLAEVEQLMCMSRLRRSQGQEPSTSSSTVDSPSSSNAKNKETTNAETSQDTRWDTYHRVRANRHSRLRGKTKRRREDSGGPHVACPVCQVPLQGTNEQFSAHVESCLRKNGDMLDEDETVDIEGDGDTQVIEDYGWTLRRSRTSPNNYCAINMTTSSRRRDEENDSMEVVVDEDETPPGYGRVQYTESETQTQDGSKSAQHDVKVRPWEDDDGECDTTKIREIKSKGCGVSHDGNHCAICSEKYKKSSTEQPSHVEIPSVAPCSHLQQ